MTDPSAAIAGSPPDTPAAAPSNLHATRPFYWSVRRELWEHRAIYIAPVAVAAVVLFGFLISMIRLPQALRAASALDGARHAARLAMPYHFTAVAIILTSLIVAVFYCLGALHGERRDRSILFWKSLPVSDLTTVIAKASIPLAVLPLVVFAVVVAVQMVMLTLSTMVLAMSGLSPALLWAKVPLVPMSLTLLYALATMTLWYAPIWGWLLLVSGWARGMTFLWAVAPPLALCLFEKIAFNTAYLWRLLGYRLGGGFTEAFDAGQHDPFGSGLALVDPVRFLASPGLWTGLAAAAGLFAAAIWLRRNREPI
jgi:ABC-2 type transport system permease protein